MKLDAFAMEIKAQPQIILIIKKLKKFFLKKYFAHKQMLKDKNRFGINLTIKLKVIIF